jgi:hypothetical protein
VDRRDPAAFEADVSGEGIALDSIETQLAAELIAMAAENESVRVRLAATGELFAGGYHPEMEAVHVRNASRLKQIIDVHGWPGRSLVGSEAADAAWMIVQHAIGYPGFQRRGLELVRDAARRGDADPVQVAMLEDRIRVFEGRPQVYGTQYDWDADGRMSPYPIEDPVQVEQRRTAIGLDPLDEHTARVRASLSPDDQPVKDYETRRQEFEEWASRAGWR